MPTKFWWEKFGKGVSLSLSPASLDTAKFEMKGSIEDTGAALKQAWVTMRHDQPELACIAQE